MLEVEYLTSSTDAAGAVRLARIALGRLTKSASP
jgi:YD repeat-containing protein